MFASILPGSVLVLENIRCQGSSIHASVGTVVSSLLIIQNGGVSAHAQVRVYAGSPSSSQTSLPFEM